MVSNSSNASLPPREVHLRLVEALKALERAQRNAVLWFAEVVRRKIYRGMGYSSIYQYAEQELGFKKAKTAQFLRLSESLKELPELRRSVARGELSWTKAREVAKVATAETEGSWIREAKRVPNRELERRVTEKKRQARAGACGLKQATLEMGVMEEIVSAVFEDKDPGNGGAATGGVRSEVELPVPVDVHVRMTAEQYARYQALMEALEKGVGDKAELLLAGLERLVLESQPVSGEVRSGTADRAPGRTMRTEEFTRVNSRSPYQVIVHQCPTCEKGTVATGRGEKPLSPQDLRTILCDAQKRGSGERNKAAVPEKLRRAVLERDRYRCRSAGCGRTGFLAVHHLTPRKPAARTPWRT